MPCLGRFDRMIIGLHMEKTRTFCYRSCQFPVGWVPAALRTKTQLFNSVGERDRSTVPSRSIESSVPPCSAPSLWKVQAKNTYAEHAEELRTRSMLCCSSRRLIPPRPVKGGARAWVVWVGARIRETNSASSAPRRARRRSFLPTPASSNKPGTTVPLIRSTYTRTSFRCPAPDCPGWCCPRTAGRRCPCRSCR